MIGRLRGRAAFARLRREGTRVRSGALWLTMLADPSLSYPHVGFAIGRAVGPAVVRNRLRRQLRGLLRARASTIAPGWYVIGCTPGAAGRSSAELAVDLDRCLARTAEVSR